LKGKSLKGKSDSPTISKARRKVESNGDVKVVKRKRKAVEKRSEVGRNVKMAAFIISFLSSPPFSLFFFYSETFLSPFILHLSQCASFINPTQGWALFQPDHRK
jgi:hypothetical protein